MAKRRKKPARAAAPTKTKKPVGRPPLFKSPKIFGKKIAEYFAWCIQSGAKATTPGLALHLGFETRQALADLRIRMEKKIGDLSTRDRRAGANIIPREFIRLINRARLTIESQRMSDMVSGRKGMSTRGMEFDLQCNFGYVPKEAVEHSGDITVEKVVEFKK